MRLFVVICEHDRWLMFKSWDRRESGVKCDHIYVEITLRLTNVESSREHVQSAGSRYRRQQDCHTCESISLLQIASHTALSRLNDVDQAYRRYVARQRHQVIPE